MWREKKITCNSFVWKWIMDEHVDIELILLLDSIVCHFVFYSLFPCVCVCVCHGRAHCDKREHQINNRSFPFFFFFFFRITLYPSLALPSNLIFIMVYSVFNIQLLHRHSLQILLTKKLISIWVKRLQCTKSIWIWNFLRYLHYRR